MNAWNIYWVMQLDSINGTVQWFALVSFFCAAVLGGTGAATENDYPWMLKRAGQMMVLSVVCAILSAFIPDTKTAAAMIVLPAIANNETLHKEGSELYKLTKQALAKAADISATDNAEEK